MQPTERLSHATPVGLCLGPLAMEVLQELGLPREISIAPGPETTHREVPSETHAPYVVGYTASEWFDAADVFTP